MNERTTEDQDVRARRWAEEIASAPEDELWAALADLSHKINNPLTSLAGRAQLLKMQADLDPRVEKAAEVIDEASRRVADYVRELARIIAAKRRAIEHGPPR